MTNSNGFEHTYAIKSDGSAQHVPTSIAVPFNQSKHGKMRRVERGISKRDLQEAMRYGKRYAAGVCPRTKKCRSKYFFNGVVYIVEDETGREVTSWAIPYELSRKPISNEMVDSYRNASEELKSNSQCMLSHAVIIVDASGSMRKTDVKGARNRLQSVWLSLAQDFVAHRINSGIANIHDAITLILMRNDAEILFEKEPTSWDFYNKMVNIYQRQSIRPKSHGNYIPCLEVAERYLNYNDRDSCSKLLLFLSDGRPSDKSEKCSKNKTISAKTRILNCVENMARKLGPQLSIRTIGIGSADNFEVLEAMSNAGKEYGTEGNFLLPSLSTCNLGAAISSVATSLTSSRTDLNHDKNTERRFLRSVSREPHTLASLQRHTQWAKKDDFEFYLYGSVKRRVFCPNERKLKSDNLQEKLAIGVVININAFGEGSERLAYRFYEISGIEDMGSKGRVVGPPLCAKEWRFETNLELPHKEMSKRNDDFLNRFCKTHLHATLIAKEFNMKLENIPLLHPDTPRVSFLDISVYDIICHTGNRSLLVEPLLDPNKFQKWNSNNGWVQSSSNELDTIQEVDSDNEENTTKLKIKSAEVLQAFSHFSYVHSGGKILICDLQGIFDGNSKKFLLTDPSIHYHNCEKEDKGHVYGSTDRGKKGINDFFSSHRCNELCEIITRGYKQSRPSKSMDRNTERLSSLHRYHQGQNPSNKPKRKRRRNGSEIVRKRRAPLSRH